MAPAALTSSAHGVDRRFAGAYCRRPSRRYGTPAPNAAPSSDGQLPERYGQRQLECPTGAYRHPSSEYPRVAPAEESQLPDNSRFQSSSRLFVRSASKSDRLSVYSSRSLVGLHLLEGFPDFPFGDVERLYLVHRLLLLPVGFSWPVVSAGQCSPFGPAPLQSLHP